jgi:hypothetical protein
MGRFSQKRDAIRKRRLRSDPTRAEREICRRRQLRHNNVVANFTVCHLSLYKSFN